MSGAAADDEAQALKSRNRWIGVMIALLAGLLAICSMGGSNAAKDSARSNLNAANLWAFFQAKNMRLSHYAVARDQLAVTLLAQPDLPADARAQIAEKIAAYDRRIARYKSAPETGEGLKELSARARDFERSRDLDMKREPYFDYGEALLQIAIVLASVAIVTGGNFALILSSVVGALGTMMMLNGFYLFADWMPHIDAFQNALRGLAEWRPL